MNSLIIASSPRKGMFSDRIAEIARIRTNGSIVHLREKKIGPCHACDYCKEIKKGSCIQSDDMTSLYSDFKKAETIYLISPIYWWQVNTQMKQFIDRLYAMEDIAWKDKKVVVILNGAADDNDREFKILEEAFNEMFEYLGVEHTFLGVGTTDENDWEKKRDKINSFIERTLL